MKVKSPQIILAAVTVSIRNLSLNELLAEYAITRGELVRDEIIKRNLGLARSIGLRYARAFGERFCEADDLIDWAMISLWKSVESFDESKVAVNKTLEHKFSMYAAKKMALYIIDRYRYSLPHSRGLAQLGEMYDEYLYSYFKQYGRYPNDEEIETYLNSLYDAQNRGQEQTPLFVDPTRQNVRTAIGLDRSSMEVSKNDAAKPANFDDHLEGKKLFDDIFNSNKFHLEEDDRQVLYYLYVKELGVNKTAKKLKVSTAHIIQTRDRLLPRLRGAIYREQQELKESLV